MKDYPPRLLLIDDDLDTAESVHRLLRLSGFPAPRHASTPASALRSVEDEPPDLVLLDLHLGSSSGLELLPLIQEKAPEALILVITGQDDTATAVACMKAGARDFLVKPLDPERLLACVRNALDIRQALAENRLLRERLLAREDKPDPAFGPIVTADPALRRLFAYATVVANSPRPILITGENGTGKELLARAVHQVGGRRDGPWVTINVAGLDDQNFSDTLFGHAKGAFTGATAAREGLVRSAAGGDLLLDEIGDLRAESQVKLLRLLQEGEFFPLGSDRAHVSDVRIITSTNRDLAAAVHQGTFRADLFYRLRFHHLHLPPLRERLGDLPILVPHLLKKAASELETAPVTLPTDTLTRLAGHSFPGNVRELEGLLFDATARFSGKPIPPTFWETQLISEKNSFPPAAKDPVLRSADLSTNPHGPQSHSLAPSLADWPRLPTLQEARTLLIREALGRTQDNRAAAARLLGISPQALHQHLLRNP